MNKSIEIFKCGHPRTRANTVVRSGYARCHTCCLSYSRASYLLGPASTPAYQEWKRLYLASL
jgi:hypothetical protein